MCTLGVCIVCCTKPLAMAVSPLEPLCLPPPYLSLLACTPPISSVSAIVFFGSLSFPLIANPPQPPVRPTLGATAVLLGRPMFFSLAVGGQEGVQRMLSIIRDELEAAMALCGCQVRCGGGVRFLPEHVEKLFSLFLADEKCTSHAQQFLSSVAFNLNALHPAILCSHRAFTF